MTGNRAFIAPTLAAVTLAALLGLGGAALAQSTETAASDAPGGEGRTGTLPLVGMAYNDGSTSVLPVARAQ
jgi:hypothetical protein